MTPGYARCYKIPPGYVRCYEPKMPVRVIIDNTRNYELNQIKLIYI